MENYDCVIVIDRIEKVQEVIERGVIGLSQVMQVCQDLDVFNDDESP